MVNVVDGHGRRRRGRWAQGRERLISSQRMPISRSQRGRERSSGRVTGHDRRSRGLYSGRRSPAAARLRQRWKNSRGKKSRMARIRRKDTFSVPLCPTNKRILNYRRDCAFQLHDRSSLDPRFQHPFHTFYPFSRSESPL
ncbi:hypothetical protein PUN28_004875 [Cardiocondyla obscurior]|uniref:Uncharacterized protein n=1 Tax=Cardiocondyla obscurior TaxID=286306 RepID=A0AAW2GER3_9HYME